MPSHASRPSAPSPARGTVDTRINFPRPLKLQLDAVAGLRGLPWTQVLDDALNLGFLAYCSADELAVIRAMARATAAPGPG